MTPNAANDPGVEIAVRLRLACEAHDPTIGGHLDRVRRYADVLGCIAGLSEVRLAELHYATPLHDLGKIGMPMELLNKPGSLSPAEMEVIKQHTIIGHRILDGSAWPVIRCAAQIALSHHECWNGSGYPHGLNGLQIPFDARIVAIADVYDALLSPRAYKPAWDDDRVITEMRKMRATRFDPDFFDLFVSNLPRIAAAAELTLQPQLSEPSSSS